LLRDAAITCFTTAGYDGTTMAQIAKEAGVAVQTLYFTFHTKAQLLQQTLERAVLGDGPPVPPPQTQWYQAMLAQPAIRPALEHLVSGVSEILQRVAPLRPAGGKPGSPRPSNATCSPHQHQGRPDAARRPNKGQNVLSRLSARVLSHGATIAYSLSSSSRRNRPFPRTVTQTRTATRKGASK
jgi:AcrR family transcriptional regulator